MKLEDIERYEAEAEAELARQTGNAPEGKTEDKQEQVGEPEKKGEEPPEDKAAAESKDKVAGPGNDGLTLENAKERLLNAEAGRKSMQANMTKATQEAADLRRENESIKAEIESLKATVAELKSAPPKVEEPAKPSQLDEFADKYGDDFSPVVDGIRGSDEKLNAVNSEVETVKDELARIRSEKKKDELEAANEAAWNKHWTAVTTAHPDATGIVESEDYQGWVLRQSEDIQRANRVGSTLEVIHVISLYKSSQAPANQGASEPVSDDLLNKAKQVADPNVGSVQETPNGSDDVPWFTQEEIAEMASKRPLEFAEKEALIDKAGQMGRIR